MKRILLLLPLLFSLTVVCQENSNPEEKGAAEKSAKAPAKAKAKRPPHPSLKPIQETPGIPRVLLIGDSISMGYTLPTREILDGVANVHRIPINGGPTSRSLEKIDGWLNFKEWDVIHFNWGIHDLKIMEDGKRQVEAEDYEKNLRTMVRKMKATGATLIFATTTPIPNGQLEPDRKFGDVAEYNEIATKVMEEFEVKINDLNAHISPRLEELQKPKDLHFTPKGSEFLAEAVAKIIEESIYD
ncbi:MAG: SGNH/GDSL hydrolase family protein [Verrucomicrobiales bacterium]|nr:SGNH/GDSL hydrolase family protein [Verrucomicrobiales bacterium]